MTNAERSRRRRLDPALRRELDDIYNQCLERIREEQAEALKLHPLTEDDIRAMIPTDEDIARWRVTDEDIAAMSDEQRAAVDVALAKAMGFTWR
ncbi:MAG: hypothetical protein ACLQF1_05790 [Methyloceanibacter sp.]|jgi:hypothetical protein